MVTWNVKGPNHPVKRGKVLVHLKALSSDIIFLQETHLNKNEYTKLRCRWIGQTYHATCRVRTRGVAILFKKGTPFVHKSTIADKEGRYLILVGELYSLPVTLVNVYGPNTDSPSFYKHVLAQIPDISQTNLIIGGDLNLRLIFGSLIVSSSTSLQLAFSLGNI